MIAIRQIFTDKADRTDEMAILAVIGVLTFIGLSIFAVVWQGKPFDPQAYGIGLGSAIGAAAMGMGLKAKMEPAKEDGDARDAR